MRARSPRTLGPAGALSLVLLNLAWIVASLACMSMMTACDEVGVFHLELRVDLSVTDGGASGGGRLTFTFTNTGEETVEPDTDRFEFFVLDARSVQIRRVDPDPSSGTSNRLAAGSSVSALWDGRDGEGRLAVPGEYRVVVPYRAAGERRTRSEFFTIE